MHCPGRLQDGCYPDNLKSVCTILLFSEKIKNLSALFAGAYEIFPFKFLLIFAKFARVCARVGGVISEDGGAEGRGRGAEGNFGFFGVLYWWGWGVDAFKGGWGRAN